MSIHRKHVNTYSFYGLGAVRVTASTSIEQIQESVGSPQVVSREQYGVSGDTDHPLTTLTVDQ